MGRTRHLSLLLPFPEPLPLDFSTHRLSPSYKYSLKSSQFTFQSLWTHRVCWFSPVFGWADPKPQTSLTPVPRPPFYSTTQVPSCSSPIHPCISAMLPSLSVFVYACHALPTHRFSTRLVSDCARPHLLSTSLILLILLSQLLTPLSYLRARFVVKYSMRQSQSMHPSTCELNETLIFPCRARNGPSHFLHLLTRILPLCTPESPAPMHHVPRPHRTYMQHSNIIHI